MTISIVNENVFGYALLGGSENWILQRFQHWIYSAMAFWVISLNPMWFKVVYQKIKARKHVFLLSCHRKLQARTYVRTSI